MAKRPVGYPQMVLTLFGFALFVGYILWFMMGLLRTASDPTGDLEAFQRHVLARGWIAGAGLAICAFAWFWALVSSRALLRDARLSAVPPPLP